MAIGLWKQNALLAVRIDVVAMSYRTCQWFLNWTYNDNEFVKPLELSIGPPQVAYMGFIVLVGSLTLEPQHGTSVG